MEKQKRWQVWLVIAVIALTLYNILPTIFYYSKPLKKPIGQKEAMETASQIASRLNGLEGFTLSWLKAQSRNLGLKATRVTLDPQNPRFAHVSFRKPEEAQLFAQTLLRAGAMIPFVPAQLTTDARSFGEEVTTVIVQRKVGMHIDRQELPRYFQFISKMNEAGTINPLYATLISDRVLPIALGFGQMYQEPVADLSDEAVIRLARTLTDYEITFGDQSAIAKRYFATFSAQPQGVSLLLGRMETLNQAMAATVTQLKQMQADLQKKGEFLEPLQQQKLELVASQQNVLMAATTIVKRNISAFDHGPHPLTRADILSAPIQETKVQTIDIGDRNPFVSQVLVDWNHDRIDILLHDDVVALREKPIQLEADAIQREKLNQLLFNEIARVARGVDEKMTPVVGHFSVDLNHLTGSQSVLALDLQHVAHDQAQMVQNLVQTAWTPHSIELQPHDYPIVSYEAYQNLDAQAKKLGMFVYTPTTEQDGFRPGSLYVIAKGVMTIRQKYATMSDSAEKTTFETDIVALHQLMRQNGFISYQGSASNLSSLYRNDLIFELSDYTSYLLAATREDFVIKGSRKFALLEFTDVEQRLLTRNKIDTAIQEDLIRWQDEYNQTRVALNEQNRYDVPHPIHSVLLSNLKLSTLKYFRGDERKVLTWGLDLSGGKTVRIGLRDPNDQPLSNPDDLKQAVNELYQRVNRLGVSEVGIRTEGPTIVLDFPGSQGLSASDLIQASAMYFNVVNEKFSPYNPMLAEAANLFLEEVWNEAVITNRTDTANLQDIAWQHLGGNPEHPEEFHPITTHARLLYDQGLRLAGSKTTSKSSLFDDTLSMIALYRGADFTSWQGQTHPLLITFRNFALEGANLTDVQAAYDSKDGNVLHFGVKSNSTNRLGQRINPRDDFYSWTSQFSQEKIVGTVKETYSKGQGWRMAVILNGTVISAPTLHSPLRDQARITGNFSQREVTQLAADLKAGSLSFTPYILSEENVSPELGKEQRTQGIVAGVLALCLIFVVMCAYYRFGGVVASVAVLFNLLIIWGVLQNLGAAITLPGLAGIILALGMAVDANVLVFERIREEFAISKRLPSAIQAGYRKAFSAIIDSNLTTIIAALILLNFDAGPIKGFALTLIIGIISSMFTALFMTRLFFTRWVQNPAHKELKMSRFFTLTSFDFLGKAKTALILSGIVLVIGGAFFAQQRHTIFGMDFTGGYALSVDLQEQAHVDYRQVAEKAIVQAGASPSDFQVRELNRPNQLRIQLSTGMELPGKPFANLDTIALPETPLFTYQTYPRIVWIVQALAQEGLELNPATLPGLNLNWTEMSGQLSDTMRNQAFFGLLLALLCILIYITFRFEFKYAISATLALAHDLVMTLGLLAVLHLLFDSIRIDLQVIGALMTIVGYSLNDTIIIFDRIREETRLMRKSPFREVINHALNVTLSRTVMTSGTTLLVLLVLVCLGGKTLFNFALIMSLGIAIGTLSSLFVASPLLLFFHERAEARKDESSVSKKI